MHTNHLKTHRTFKTTIQYARVLNGCYFLACLKAKTAADQTDDKITHRNLFEILLNQPKSDCI